MEVFYCPLDAHADLGGGDNFLSFSFLARIEKPEY